MSRMLNAIVIGSKSRVKLIWLMNGPGAQKHSRHAEGDADTPESGIRPRAKNKIEELHKEGNRGEGIKRPQPAKRKQDAVEPTQERPVEIVANRSVSKPPAHIDCPRDKRREDQKNLAANYPPAAFCPANADERDPGTK